MKDICDGIAAMQMLNNLLPGRIRMERLKFEVKCAYDRRENILYMKRQFKNLNVNIDVNVESLANQEVQYAYLFHRKLLVFYNHNATDEHRARLNPVAVRERAIAKASNLKNQESETRRQEKEKLQKLSDVLSSPFKKPPLPTGGIRLVTPRSRKKSSSSKSGSSAQVAELQAKLVQVQSELQNANSRYENAYSLIEELNEALLEYEQTLTNVQKRLKTEEEQVFTDTIRSLFNFEAEQVPEIEQDYEEEQEQVGGTEEDETEVNEQAVSDAVGEIPIQKGSE